MFVFILHGSFVVAQISRNVYTYLENFFEYYNYIFKKSLLLYGIITFSIYATRLHKKIDYNIV